MAWEERARQLQRYYHSVRRQPHRDLVTAEDLKRAALLAPKYLLKDSPPGELQWPSNWSGENPNSLRAVLSRHEWKKLPVEAVVENAVARCPEAPKVRPRWGFRYYSDTVVKVRPEAKRVTRLAGRDADLEAECPEVGLSLLLDSALTL